MLSSGKTRRKTEAVKSGEKKEAPAMGAPGMGGMM
jgi:hypothetical protein